MDIRENILAKYKEFDEFLKSVDLKELKQQFNREELSEFNKQINAVKMRNLGFEIYDLIGQMKKEEYPELLGVHHFPIIKTIAFLSEDEKLKLDKYLLNHRVGEYISGLRNVTINPVKQKMLENWFKSNGIVEEEFVVVCSNCGRGHLSNIMSRSKKEELEAMFNRSKDEQNEDRYEDYERLQEILYAGCSDCDNYEPIEDMTELRFKSFSKMIAKRDTSLDHV
jgi:hypothetical protein